MTSRQVRRIRFAFRQVRKHVSEIVVEEPPREWEIEDLVGEVGPLAPGLEAYFECCNGVVLPEAFPFLSSLEEMRENGSPGFLAISGDGCGNLYLVVQKIKTGKGAVVFWDHETDEITEVVASSVPMFVEGWAAGCIGAEASFPIGTPAEGKELEGLRSSRRFNAWLAARKGLMYGA